MGFSAHQPSKAPGSADGELDLAGMGRAVARRKMWIVWPTLACLLGSAAFVLLVTPKYTASSNVLVENQESYFTRPGGATQGGGESASMSIDPEAVSSQVQIATSRDLARRAVNELGLKGNAEFDPTAKEPGLLTSLLGGVPPGSAEDRTVENFLEALNVVAVVKTRVLLIEFTSRDPGLAARAANKMADLYINAQSDAKRNAARLSAASLSSLIAGLKTKVTTAEAAADEFRSSAGLTIGANNITMSGQQLADLTQQLGLAKAAQAETQAKAKSLRDMLKEGRLGDVGEVANNELIRRLSESRATLRGQIASESRTLLPGHPRIKELNAQLAELDSEIKLAVERAARQLENDARVGGVRVENLKTAIAQQKKEAGGSSADEARARELDRVAKELKDQLESSMAKYQEATARENSESTPGDARIVSRAVSPLLPSFPKKIPIVAFATLAGLFLSTGFVVSAELMSGRAYGLGEAAVETEAPPPAPALVESDGVAAVRRRREPVDGAASRALSALTARLLAEPAGDVAQRVLAVGETDAVSARSAAAALGRALSRERRVILVELDNALGGRGGRPGLAEILTGEAGFEETIHREAGSRLHVLTAGGEAFEPDERCELILDALTRTYDIVLLVAPPIDEDGLAFSLAPDCDFAALVCEDEPDEFTMEELAQAGAGAVVPLPTSRRGAGRDAA